MLYVPFHEGEVGTFEAPSTLMHFHSKTYLLFKTFLPTIHTKTPQNGDENGDFRKGFCKWRRLKTHLFENALFLVWAGENRDFWKRSRKKHHMPSVPVQIGASIQDGGWSCDMVLLTYAQSQVPVVFLVFERFSVDRWKWFKNASVDTNICFVFAAIKT